LWIEHPAEADRRQQERQREGGPEHHDSQVDGRRLDALPRSEGDVGERGAFARIVIASSAPPSM